MHNYVFSTYILCSTICALHHPLYAFPPLPPTHHHHTHPPLMFDYDTDDLLHSMACSLHLPLMMMYLSQYLTTLTISFHWFVQENSFIWQLVSCKIMNFCIIFLPTLDQNHFRISLILQTGWLRGLK